MASQSLSPTRNLGRESLRSLAPLLNDLPPPTLSMKSSCFPACPKESSLKTKSLGMPIHLNLNYSQTSTPPPTTKSIRGHETDPPRTLINPSSLESFSSQSENPHTKSSCHLHLTSPSSYNSYFPELNSVSSPILASPFNNPDHNGVSPSKRSRKLPNPKPNQRNVWVNPQDSTETQKYIASTTTRMIPHYAKSLLPEENSAPGSKAHIPNSFCSGPLYPSSCPVNEPIYPQNSNGQTKKSHLYPHLVRNMHALGVDQGQTSCYRPLKNTKRAAQNRAAQRAFRDRKHRYVRELEIQSRQLTEYVLKFGLLEELEPHIEDCEAKLNNCTPQSETGDSAKKIKKTMNDDEKLNYINQLENQVEISQREISRLKEDLMEFNCNYEIDKSRRIVMDWKMGKHDFFKPQNKNYETDAQTSGSSGSPSTMKSTGSHYPKSQSLYKKYTQKNNEKTTDIQNHSMCHEQNGHGNKRPLLFITTEKEINTILAQEHLRNKYYDEGNSPDSHPIYHHQQLYPRPVISSNKIDPIRHYFQKHFTKTQHTSESHNPGAEMERHPIPLHRANKLDNQEQLVRLPGIQGKTKHNWEKNNQPNFWL